MKLAEHTLAAAGMGVHANRWMGACAKLAWAHNAAMTNEEVVRAYAGAVVAHDRSTIARLRHRDWTSLYPQSGEVVDSTDDDFAILDAYPGGEPQLELTGRLVGTEDRWAVSPLGGGAYRVAGDGENWWAEWRMTYPDGRKWFTIILIELRDGLVWRDTVYWAEPFDPPEWRSQWVRNIGS
jgi:hypothetical protein